MTAKVISLVDMRAGFDYDSHDPAIAVDPFPTYAKLRESCPMQWSRAWDGYWVATGHHEVSSAARDARTFQTAQNRADGTVQGVTIPSLGQSNRMIPLELDSPECLKYRKLISVFYSPKRVAARAGEVRQLAAACIDEVIERGECDIVLAMTEKLPSILTMRDIGLPEERWFDIDSLLYRALFAAPHDPSTARECAQLICLELVEALDAQRDGDRAGLLGHLATCEVDGAPIPDDDIVSMMYLLLLGIYPTSSLTAIALRTLAQQPELRSRLMSDRSLIRTAVDEFLRWVSPVQSTGRIAAEDVELGGQRITRGEQVLLGWAAANRDDSVFPHSDRIDLNRDAGRHLAFGAGQHYCVGAAMVREMFTAMLEEVFDRIPDYTVADDAAIEWFPDLTPVYGIKALPIRFAPGR
ncbi:cytochrome P450 [Streptomyces tendae]|uniref:cytochrome P450 n=1 Tax=Streptomyces tendae TaxID=1932 RepID=UPI0037A7CC96